MGLLSILRKIKQKEKEVRILVLGLDNAGKTTIVKRLCGQPIDHIEPTLGFQITTLEYQNLSLNLWDVGGQTSLRAYWRNYFEATDGIIWVVDSADQIRMDLCRQELGKLLVQDRLAGATLLILANKQDVNGALPVRDMVKKLNLHDDMTRHWNIVSCSALSGDGLETAIGWLVSDIQSRIFSLGIFSSLFGHPHLRATGLLGLSPDAVTNVFTDMTQQLPVVFEFAEKESCFLFSKAPQFFENLTNDLSFNHNPSFIKCIFALQM